MGSKGVKALSKVEKQREKSKETFDKSFLVKLMRKLAPDFAKVSEWVKEVKKENPKLSPEELADYLSDRIVWTYTRQGIALALPGAVPGFGTIVQIATEFSAISVDIALMIRNQTYLVFALGCCYGIKGRETLIQDSLICIGLWTKALALTKQRVIKIGSKVAGVQFKKKFPAKILQAINKKVGRTILTKYGTKRGGITIGKLIPFGVGTVVGGGFNYLVMKAFKRHAMEYFKLKKIDKKKKNKKKVKSKVV